MRYKKDLADFISITDGARLIQERAGLSGDESKEDIVAALRDGALEVQYWSISRGERSRCRSDILLRELQDNLAPDLIDWERSIARRRGVGAQFKAEIEVSRASICHLWPDVSEPPPGQEDGQQNATIAAETECRDWLIKFMSKGGAPDGLKTDYRSEAKKEFGVGTKAFDRAWRNAIIKTGNAKWARPGPRS